MTREDVLQAMKRLRLNGMLAVYPQLLPEGIKKRWGPERILLELMKAEEAERRLRSIRYRLSQAKFPMGKGLDSFDFKSSPVNEEQIRHLYQGSFVSDSRNLVFIGGTGTGKTHLAIAIARQAVQEGCKGRFYNLADLANDLEREKLEGLGGKLAEKLARMDLVVLDELGYLPFSKNGGQLIFHLVSKLYERTSIITTTNLAFGGVDPGLPQRQNDHCPLGSPDTSLRHHRNRERKLEAKEQVLTKDPKFQSPLRGPN